MGAWGWVGNRESRRGRGGEKGRVAENLWERYSEDGKGTAMEKKRDILIEGAIVGQARNMALRIQKDDPS